MHMVSEPSILYFGTPVVLVGTTNEDRSHNLAPMSSAFWLGWRCILGLGSLSKTPANLSRTGECVLNLPSADLVDAVNRLAKTTGSDPVPRHKVQKDYRFERDKFGLSGFTADPGDIVAAPRARECPVQLEARLEAVHGVADNDPKFKGAITLFEVRIVRVHLDPAILMEGEPDRVDPDKWRPLIMSFQEFYGLAPDKLRPSTLAEIPERAYRSPDVARARDERKKRLASECIAQS
jgi:flavin reductase (DIM6/NTAB) family NADH-FMN oxidoreductase RutF